MLLHIRSHIVGIPPRRGHGRRAVFGRAARTVSVLDVLDAGGSEDVGDRIEAGVLKGS